MMKISNSARIFVLLLSIAWGVAACTSSGEDDLAPQIEEVRSNVVGRWYGEVTGTTYTLWNYGRVWQESEFKTDGTGTTTIYYLMGDVLPVACEHYAFTYTTDTNGQTAITATERPGSASAELTADQTQLLLTTRGQQLTFKKVDQAMSTQLDEWAQQELDTIPAPARYTVFVYGNAGGAMDHIIEKGFWEKLKPLLTDCKNVRVVCLYKYGKLPEESNDPLPKYGQEGDVVWFELNDKTDLTKLTEEGLIEATSFEVSQGMKICDPKTIRMFIEASTLHCPAQEYVLAIWGHGSGFNPMADIPGKYDAIEPFAARTRGVIGDEWVGGEELDMYELSAGIRTAGLKRLNTIFFHNCLMGNLETLTELRDVTERIVASSHLLSSDGTILAEYVRGLQDTGDSEKAFAQMFARYRTGWEQEIYTESCDNLRPDEPFGGMMNGDLKMIRASGLDAIIDGAKRMASRLVELYPTQQEAIDRATRHVYRYNTPPDMVKAVSPFFDLADYGHLLAYETGDSELSSISQAIDHAFSNAFVQYADVNFNEQHLDHYTLSVCLANDATYLDDYLNKFIYQIAFNPICNFDTGYEQCTFHQLTGWGNWLRTNKQMLWGNPGSRGGAALVK